MTPSQKIRESQDQHDRPPLIPSQIYSTQPAGGYRPWNLECPSKAKERWQSCLEDFKRQAANQHCQSCQNISRRIACLTPGEKLLIHRRAGEEQSCGVVRLLEDVEKDGGYLGEIQARRLSIEAEIAQFKATSRSPPAATKRTIARPRSLGSSNSVVNTLAEYELAFLTPCEKLLLRYKADNHKSGKTAMIDEESR